MSSDFYQTYIIPYAAIIIKICRAYTNTQEDFEDYYQEVCLQIWRTRDNYNGKAEWSTWIYRLSLNVCMTLLKKRRTKRKHFSGKEVNTEVLSASAKSAKEDAPIEQLYQAIRQLSEVDRAVILLYLEEHSYKEIAEIIGTNANNIGVRIKRIKQRLKKLLDGKLN